LLLKQEQQPELFDKTDITSFEYEGKRYVLCRHDLKGYRNELLLIQRRRKVYEELKHIQKSPQNKNDKKLYHRAMRALEQYEQTAFWEIKIDHFLGKKGEDRYRLNFRLKRKVAIVHDKIGHYYLLHTDLEDEQITDDQIVENYKSLMKVERSFRDIKSQIKIRPIRHWKHRRIKAHIYLCYLSLWLSKYIENRWRKSNICAEVGQTLADWDDVLRMCEKVDPNGNMVEAGWNKGANAKATMQLIETHGEAEAINAYS